MKAFKTGKSQRGAIAGIQEKQPGLLYRTPQGLLSQQQESPPDGL